MKLFVLMLLTGLAVARVKQRGFSSGQLEKFLQSDDQRSLFDFLMTKSNIKPRSVGAYSFQNCGDPSKEQVVVSQLVISPDPVPSDGPLTITMRATATAKVVAPVKASVTLQKKILGQWITVPCVDGFGSCPIDDVCQLLQKIKTCPPALVKNKVPCHCPLPVGNYSLPGVVLNVDLNKFPTGGYSAKLDMAATTGPVGCYQVTFTLQ